MKFQGVGESGEKMPTRLKTSKAKESRSSAEERRNERHKQLRKGKALMNSISITTMGMKEVSYYINGSERNLILFL